MALFVNGKMEPGLYKTQSPVHDPNQGIFHLNYMAQFIDQQQEVSHQLNHSVQEVNALINHTQLQQSDYFEEVLSRIEKQDHFSKHLASMLKIHEQTALSILERLSELEQLQKGIEKQVEGEGFVQKAILDQLSFLDQKYDAFSNKLENYGQMNQELKNQLDSQQTIYHDISRRLNNEEIYHKTVMERLDQQDALSHKLSRQLDSLRENIFERFSYLADQLQYQLRISASYLIGLFSRSSFIYRPGIKNKIKEEEKIKN